MENRSKTIVLNESTSERITKRIALNSFKSLRYCAATIQSLPSHLHQASKDIRDAWQETSCPKA